jgi:hypothetical protein
MDGAGEHKRLFFGAQKCKLSVSEVRKVTYWHQQKPPLRVVALHFIAHRCAHNGGEGCMCCLCGRLGPMRELGWVCMREMGLVGCNARRDGGGVV